LFVAALARPATAQPPLEAARGLLAAWHDDPARIDRARVLLEAEAAADPSADTLVELSRAWFLTGDFRARSEPDRLAAYEQGGRAGAPGRHGRDHSDRSATLGDERSAACPGDALRAARAGPRARDRSAVAVTASHASRRAADRPRLRSAPSSRASRARATACG